MNKARKAHDAMMQAADAADAAHRALLNARARGASEETILKLHNVYVNRSQVVNDRWDDWNDALLEQRLAPV